LIAGAGAMLLSVRQKPDSATRRRGRRERPAGRSAVSTEVRLPPVATSQVLSIAVALGLSGFAGMGMEILWFRHFTILLGGFRGVFSLLLTVILLGMAVGAVVSTLLSRWRDRLLLAPARSLMVVQGLFVCVTLLGLALADARQLEAVVLADPGYQV